MSIEDHTRAVFNECYANHDVAYEEFYDNEHRPDLTRLPLASDLVRLYYAVLNDPHTKSVSVHLAVAECSHQFELRGVDFDQDK